MAETGFTQDEINAYTEIVMDPLRYAVQNSSRDIPEECGTFATYEVYNAVDNSLLASTTGLSLHMVTLQMVRNIATISKQYMMKEIQRLQRQLVELQIVGLLLHLQMSTLRYGTRKSHFTGQSLM